MCKDVRVQVRNLAFAVAGVGFLISSVFAAGPYQIGSGKTATADPLVPRPKGTPCVVQLFSNFRFAHFSDSTQTFSFTPPSSCPGPWEEVVFEVDYSENAGDQFDRTASIYLGDANIYFGTTPEPLPTDTNTWHVERNVTDYSALFTTSQVGTMVLVNCTTDCPPPFNTLNGVFTVSANLEFYPAHQPNRAPRTPDAVLPLMQPNSGGGVNLPAFLYSPSDQLTTTFTLPQNVEQAYLDVITESQFIDEQWYACFPNDLSNINLVYGCGNTAFRETEISIDGQPAGVAPVSPRVYTGFLPDDWAPIPGVQTLNFVPYRVNLTPFAGLLSNGQPHTIALSVFNDDNYFAVTASLLLYVDPTTAQITGGITENTLTNPSPVVAENLEGTSIVTGTIDVKSHRNYTIAGFINTSHGKIATSVLQQQDFSARQEIDFDAVNFTVLDQKTSLKTKLSSLTTVSGPEGTVTTWESFSFPITVDFTFPVSSSLFGFTAAFTQTYQTSKLVSENGIVTDFNSLTNSVKATDANRPSSSQQYTSFDLKGALYNCALSSEANLLTSVSAGCPQE